MKTICTVCTCYLLFLCSESRASIIFTFSDAGGGQTRMEGSGSIDLDAPGFGPATTSFPSSSTRFLFQQSGSNTYTQLDSYNLGGAGNDRFQWSSFPRTGTVEDVFPFPPGNLEGNPPSLPLGTSAQGYSINVSGGIMTLWMNVGDSPPTTWSPGPIDTLLDIDFSNFGAPGASFSYQPTADPNNLLTFQIAAAQVATVPEPSTATLFALGLLGFLGFAAWGRRARRP